LLHRAARTVGASAPSRPKAVPEAIERCRPATPRGWCACLRLAAEDHSGGPRPWCAPAGARLSRRIPPLDLGDLSRCQRPDIVALQQEVELRRGFELLDGIGRRTEAAPRNHGPVVGE